MTDLFVSYSREDRERVKPLVSWLEQSGFSVWWDTRIEPGSAFDDTIDLQLSGCSAVLVIWSEHSVNSNWVQAEAAEGLDRGILVPIRIDDVRAPLPFRRIQGAELVGFPERHDEQVFEQLHDVLQRLVDKHVPAAHRPNPAPRGPHRAHGHGLLVRSGPS